jgi:hypothetical protein
LERLGPESGRSVGSLFVVAEQGVAERLESVDRLGLNRQDPGSLAIELERPLRLSNPSEGISPARILGTQFVVLLELRKGFRELTLLSKQMATVAMTLGISGLEPSFSRRIACPFILPHPAARTSRVGGSGLAQ